MSFYKTYLNLKNLTELINLVSISDFLHYHILGELKTEIIT